VAGLRAWDKARLLVNLRVGGGFSAFSLTVQFLNMHERPAIASAFARPRHKLGVSLFEISRAFPARVRRRREAAVVDLKRKSETKRMNKRMHSPRFSLCLPLSLSLSLSLSLFLAASIAVCPLRVALCRLQRKRRRAFSAERKSDFNKTGGNKDVDAARSFGSIIMDGVAFPATRDADSRGKDQ